jgi:hypothetical protein
VLNHVTKTKQFMLYVAQVVFRSQINTKYIYVLKKPTYVYVKLVVHVLTTGMRGFYSML